ncbi:Nitroreductase family protein [compost metagenome]
MQLMLALETLGLSTCPINWPDIEERERMLSDKIGLSYHERPIMLLAVGYADPVGGIPYSQKKIEQELIKII